MVVADLQLAFCARAGLELKTPGAQDTAFELSTSTIPRCAVSANVTCGWKPAKATTDGKTVMVTAAGHENSFTMGPTMVRYAWAAVPFQYKAAVLYAKAEQLPAGGFVSVAK